MSHREPLGSSCTPVSTGHAAGFHGACWGSLLLLDMLPLLGTAVSSLGSAALFGQVLWFLPAHSSSFFVSHQAATAIDTLKALSCPNYPVAHGKTEGMTLPSLCATLSRVFLNHNALQRY